MTSIFAAQARHARRAVALGALWLGQVLAAGTDWPQYRGPATDGTTPDLIATTWATNSPGFVVWTNMSLSNGFSSFAVSQGRAFAMISRDDGNGTMLEYCAAVDAATGTNLWATPVGDAPWYLEDVGNGGAGLFPYYKGDGPRTTPSVMDGRVVALSGFMHLVCLNSTNGSVLCSNDLTVV